MVIYFYNTIAINTLNKNALKFSYRSFESKLCSVLETLQLGMAMLCLGQLLLVYLEALESILEELDIVKEMIAMKYSFFLLFASN